MALYGHFHLVPASELCGLRAQPERIRMARLLSAPVGKTWHLLHLLLSGSLEGGEAPENFILHGEVLAEADFAYGPILVHPPEKVADIHKVLDALPFDELWKRHEPDHANARELFHFRHEAATPHDVRAPYEALRSLVAQGAAQGHALVGYIEVGPELLQ